MSSYPSEEASLCLQASWRPASNDPAPGPNWLLEGSQGALLASTGSSAVQEDSEAQGSLQSTTIKLQET